MTDSVPELAEEISPSDEPPAMSMRVGIITAIELGGSHRVQVDIAADTWLNRLQDLSIEVGNRVSVLQQGPVMLIVGRLDGNHGIVPIGAVSAWAGWFEPQGWLACDGRELSRSLFPDLFFVCGTAYGAGNGTSTFNIPNMNGRLPMGESLSWLRGTTSTGMVTLTQGNMPTHHHGLGGNTASGGSHNHQERGGGSGAVFAGSGSDFASADDSGPTSTDGSHTHSLSGNTSDEGSGIAFQTTGPFTSLRYLIRAL